MTTRFEVLRELGAGGEGRVLAVRDHARGGAVVALKETHGPRAAALRDEFELLTRLSHPSLVRAFDFFPESPVGARAVAAYTQAWVEGEELAPALRAADGVAREQVMVGVLGALAHLHAMGVAHLDLKPENVLVDASGTPFLVDLGVAARLGTRLAVLRGSRSYVAPELLAGAPVAASADLWAFGRMLAELDVAPEVAAALAEPDPALRPASALAVAALWSVARGRAIELFPASSAAALVRSGGRVGPADAILALRGRTAVVIGPPGSGRRSLVMAASRMAASAIEPWPLAAAGATVQGFVAALARAAPGAAIPEPPREPSGARWQEAVERWADDVVGALVPAAAGLTLAVLEPRPPRAVRAVLERLVRRAEAGAPGPRVWWAAERWDGPAALALPPFDREETRAFVASRFGAGPAADEALVGALAAMGGGRPGPMEALSELLVARGALAFGEAGWELVRPEAARELPPDLGRALDARVALLPPELGRPLGAVAALRFPASSSALAALLGEPEAAVTPRLRALVAAGLVHLGADARWAPAHPALAAHALAVDPAARARALADGSLDPRGRALLEGGAAGARRAAAIAQGLLATAPEAAEEAAELALALDPDDVAALTARAAVGNLLGPREVQRSALERLIARLPDDDPRALEARSELFWTLTRMADVGAVASAGPALATRAEVAGNPRLAAEVRVHLAITHAQTGAQDASEAELQRARELAAPLPATEPGVLGLRARIANNLGNVHAYRGRHDLALAAYEDARRLKIEEGDPVGERIATGNVGLTLVQLGRHADARDQLLASLALARRTGHRRGEAWSHLTLAELGLEGAAWAYARRHAEASTAIADALGDGLVAGDAHTTLAEAALRQGDRATAREAAQRGLARAEAAGNRLTAARARLVATLAAPTPDEATLVALATLGEAEPGTRRSAAAALAERRLQQGDVVGARALVVRALADGARTDLRWLALAELEARLGALTGEPWLADDKVRRFERFLASWPAVPAPEPDGPCQATVRGAAAVRALAARTRAGRGVDRAHALSPRLVKPSDQDAPNESVEQLEQRLASLLTGVVQEAQAERGFVVVFGPAPATTAAASGPGAPASRILAARDADGEAIADAARRLPDAAVEAARDTDKPWRGSDGRGAVIALPWSVAVGPDRQTGALVLQNRFVPTAFETPEAALRGLAALLSPLRVLALEKALSQALTSLAAMRAEASVSLARATDEIRTLRRELETTREQLGPALAYPEIVFKSGAMKRMLRQVDRVVATDLPIHVHGESGTGKELVARAIHHLGPRGKGPFVAQNCTAIPPTLFESELFGHERGAFTGAHRSTEGLFRRAHGGTLFLDEIGDLPMELQAKLLRVLETGEVRPVGATRSQSVDVRIVSATHRDLADLITKGTFREDLYYRLNVIRIDVPPLRERPDDIPVLVDHFLARRAAASGRKVTMDDAALKACLRFAWPGNVRQLENEVTRAGLLADSGVIGLADLSPEVRLGPDAPPRAGPASAAAVAPGAAASPAAGAAASPPLRALGLDKGPLKDRIAKLESIVLEAALERARHNKSEVARDLGLSRAGLNLKLKRLGLWAGDDD